MMDVGNNSDENQLTLAERNFLLYNAHESDVKFVFTQETNLEVFIYAHKRILSIGSCVFDQMFNGLMAVSLTSSDLSDAIVCITDIPIECFKNLLMFVYIGAVELNLGNVIEVMYAAHKYQVCKLESLCCEFLYKNMDIGNVLEIYELTAMFDNNITSQCLQWIDDLFDDLTKWEGFMKLKKATLMELLKRDTLSIGELNLFKAVYKWAENQCCEASIEPNDANLRAVADNFKHIRFPTMKFYEFAECTRYGLNILTQEEKIEVWDALSSVKHSVYFNSTKRAHSAMSYRAFTFSYSPTSFAENGRYNFEFRVSRIVQLNSITVIRNCLFAIYEKEPGERNFTKGTECVIHVNETKRLQYSLVPNVVYAMVTVDSFQCANQRCGGNCNGNCRTNPPNFRSYVEMQQFYNRISKIASWNFIEHDPFMFAAPQRSLIRVISYKTSK